MDSGDESGGSDNEKKVTAKQSKSNAKKKNKKERYGKLIMQIITYL